MKLKVKHIQKPVKSLLKGLAVLDAFSSEETTLGVVELSSRLGLHKSTVSRLAGTLEAAGYLERVTDGKYCLGPKLASLASLAQAEFDLRRTARPSLRALVQACGETAHLGVLENWQAVTIDFAEGLYTVRMHTVVGKRTPAHCSAMGKTLLAGLPRPELENRLKSNALRPCTPNSISSPRRLYAQLREIRQRGYSLDNEETEIGLRCIGAPILDSNGNVVAAFSVSGPAMRITADTIPQIARKVKAAAAEVSAQLGAPPNRRVWGSAPSPDELLRQFRVNG